MDAVRRVQLRIVPTESVRPHEIADPGRETRIEQRLRSDGVLRDPLMVGEVPDLDGYVLLDGTNRQRALAALGLQRVMVQVVDYADQHAVQLRTWCHATSVPLAGLLDSARSIPGHTVISIPPLAVGDVLGSPTTLSVLLDGRQRFASIYEGAPALSRVDALRRFVDLYERDMARVDCDADTVEEQAHRLTGGSSRVLVAFPPFTRSQVVSMAMSGTLIPAGITRHVIRCGRALRVNLPLSLLDEAMTIDDANAALQRHVAALQPRLYQEPTILYDS